MAKLAIDSYIILANFIPAIVSALPFLILWYFLSLTPLKDLQSFLVNLNFYGSITISVVFLFLFAQIIRVASKVFEKSFFIKKNGFPTTYLLLYSDDSYSDSYKDVYRRKVKSFFHLDLFFKNDEMKNPEEAKKLLNDSISQVRAVTRSRGLVRQHNILYGFWRNTLGGSGFSLIFCVINIGVGHFLLDDLSLIIISSILLLLYAFLLIFSKPILTSNAEEYAKQLISEFIAIEDSKS